MAYYRNLIQVEILSDEPWAEGALEDLPRVDYAITEGGHSGQVVVLVLNEEIDAERMAVLLELQGSDPSFLVRELRGRTDG